MKNPTKIVLSLIGCLFLFHITSAQTVNQKTVNIGLSSGIANMSDSESHDAEGYYHFGLNVGYYPANNFAFGLEVNTSNIFLDNGPYLAYGIGFYIRFYPVKNIFSHNSIEGGLVGDDAYDYNKFTFNLGYSLFLSKAVALEPKVFYVFHNESNKSWDFNGPGIGFGIQTYINRH